MKQLLHEIAELNNAKLQYLLRFSCAEAIDSVKQLLACIGLILAYPILAVRGWLATPRGK
jgi:hypothetical protein